jgi:hypothetical protein
VPRRDRALDLYLVITYGHEASVRWIVLCGPLAVLGWLAAGGSDDMARHAAPVPAMGYQLNFVDTVLRFCRALWCMGEGGAGEVVWGVQRPCVW